MPRWAVLFTDRESTGDQVTGRAGTLEARRARRLVVLDGTWSKARRCCGVIVADQVESADAQSETAAIYGICARSRAVSSCRRSSRSRRR